MTSYLSRVSAPWPASPFVRRLVRLALDEDLAGDDVTSEIAIEDGIACRAEVVARQGLVVCGLPIIAEIFDEHGASSAAVELLAEEGAEAVENAVLARIRADARTLLALERTILNFMQRLCGVATYTRAFVSAAAPVAVLDTRKTMPGWRVLDKYAARVGGARNHRANLSEMMLIKNNHIDVGGGVKAVLARAAKRPSSLPLEVEVRSLQELEEALAASPQMVMLDNMKDGDISKALAEIKRRAPAAQIEVSGGITARRCAALAALGVTLVSSGALTTQAPNADISMRISRDAKERR
jgi:nicotinate-nucleotide pyrophosphorylase (carboxylating)